MANLPPETPDPWQTVTGMLVQLMDERPSFGRMLADFIGHARVAERTAHRAEVERLTQERDKALTGGGVRANMLRYIARCEAAEAERDRLRAALKVALRVAEGWILSESSGTSTFDKEMADLAEARAALKDTEPA